MAAVLQLAAHALTPTLQRQMWQGDQIAGPIEQTISSGYPAFDQALPGQGWPTGSLTELLVEHDGVGEMRLLAHALRQLTMVEERHVVMIAPPYHPHAVALKAWGIAIERIFWVRATEAQAFWAAEQALKQGGMGAVLMWSSDARPEAPRRLQVAAQESRSLAFLIRPADAAAHSSAAPLRIICSPSLPEEAQEVNRRQWLHKVALTVDIIKRRGPPLAEPLRIELPVQEAMLRARAATPMRHEPKVNHVVDRCDIASLVAGGREVASVRAKERAQIESA
ncbi:translesion DNA synthesis-associated protein ImuA [Trinickia terrae]|uniref:Translesion DNA synthesis-associated protein ImuA n=1 Tax=Trinickia terrae TaxID=2571161 RepID=A0A4U1HD70_9BURK|nr:translesion DNA synthesis-associated protein ImuA [Trinickia terrae]TKC77277.1 translesion DNA synthesis-associated protein ImuA [Trinickia terrae]